MLQVLLTVDTEISDPMPADWRKAGLEGQIERDILGATDHGQFGLPFQLATLKQHNLKAVFFVEALFASASEANRTALARTVRMVESAGQEVQLHLHPEWLARTGRTLPPGRKGRDLAEFTEDEQALLIQEGFENLKSCCAAPVTAFRAGNFGADGRTLKALARNGFLFDSSYNACYLGYTCRIEHAERLTRPTLINGVTEYPIATFSDWPGHLRPAQICACSAREMRNALDGAWRAGWKSFVLLWHSFELIKRPKIPGQTAHPDWLAIKRFQQLCRFLDENRDRFVTRGFHDLETAPEGTAHPILQSPVQHTVWRMIEQVAGRFY